MEMLSDCPICSSTHLEFMFSCSDHFLTKESFSIVSCKVCGFRFTNPRPSSDQLGQYYQSPDYISHSNNRKGLFNLVYQQVRKYTLARKHALLSKHKFSGMILDIGCASGEFLNYLKSRNWSVKGVEPDNKTREYAISRYGLDIVPEDQIAAMQAESFDVITLWHVLEHVSDLNGRMESIRRLLKPDGILIIAVPISDAADAGMYGPFWAGYDVPRHLYHFSRQSMVGLLKKYSFTPMDILPMKFDAYYVCLLSEKYKSGKMNWINGFWNGFRSNLEAGKTGNYSSLIFISRKTPA